jgi:acetylornithine deacetylase/succinyl-diaminopimelate desuccinylase-like protein
MIKALQQLKLAHNRFILFFECDEESGSKDMLFYLEKFASKIGTPKLVLCLDSGTVDYEHMSLTSTLRGNMVVNLNVSVSTEGVHSGDASGIIPSSFRILRNLMDRIEDSKTG